MPHSQLSVITHAITVSQIWYALPVWGGFLSSQLAAKVDALFKRLKRFGYLDRLITIIDLISNSDNGLFKQVCSSNNYLHHLLPLFIFLITYATGATHISCQVISVMYI